MIQIIDLVRHYKNQADLDRALAQLRKRHENLRTTQYLAPAGNMGLMHDSRVQPARIPSTSYAKDLCANKTMAMVPFLPLCIVELYKILGLARQLMRIHECRHRDTLESMLCVQKCLAVAKDWRRCDHLILMSDCQTTHKILFAAIVSRGAERDVTAADREEIGQIFNMRKFA